MSNRDAGCFKPKEGQCFVCERPRAGGQWFRQAKHGDLIVHLCCRQCAKAFYARRVPSLRRLVFLAAQRSRQRPRRQAPVLSEV